VLLQIPFGSGRVRAIGHEFKTYGDIAFVFAEPFSQRCRVDFLLSAEALRCDLEQFGLKTGSDICAVDEFG